MNTQCINVSLVDGRAKVRMGSGSMQVCRRDLKDEPYHCPVELVGAALGS